MEESILFSGTSVRTGLGTDVTVSTFSPGHSTLHQSLLSCLPVVLHHFIFTAILQGLAALEEKSDLGSYSPACSLPQSNLKNILNVNNSW